MTAPRLRSVSPPVLKRIMLSPRQQASGSRTLAAGASPRVVLRDIGGSTVSRRTTGGSSLTTSPGIVVQIRDQLGPSQNNAERSSAAAAPAQSPRLPSAASGCAPVGQQQQRIGCQSPLSGVRPNAHPTPVVSSLQSGACWAVTAPAAATVRAPPGALSSISAPPTRLAPREANPPQTGDACQQQPSGVAEVNGSSGVNASARTNGTNAAPQHHPAGAGATSSLVVWGGLSPPPSALK